MAVVEGGVSGALVGVGAEASSPLHVVVKPQPVGALGSYRYAGVTGTMAAALAAGAPFWYVRWTDATRLLVVHRVRCSFQPLTAFTAATLTDFGMDLVKATAVSAGGSGTLVTPSTGVSKMRASMGASLMTGGAGGDIRIATTATLTALTTLDSNPIANSVGDQQRVNPAAATEEQRVNDPTLDYYPAWGNEYPIVLSQNEGLVLRNRAVWPAAGTGIFAVEFAWSEVTAY